MLAIRQEFSVRAILIHNRKAFHTRCTRAGFSNENDTAIEIAFVTCEACIDVIGQNVRDTAQILRGRYILATTTAGEEMLLFLRRIPETEGHAHAAVIHDLDFTNTQRFSVDNAPVGKARLHEN